MTHEYQVELEYPSLQPISATASKDGKYVSIDFVHMEEHSKALRLVLPSQQIENFVQALLHVQKAIAAPNSGIHYQERH